MIHANELNLLSQANRAIGHLEAGIVLGEARLRDLAIVAEEVAEPVVAATRPTGRYIDSYGCIWLIDTVSGEGGRSAHWTCWKEEPTGVRSMVGEVLGKVKWHNTREEAQALLDAAALNQRNWTAEVES